MVCAIFLLPVLAGAASCDFWRLSTFRSRLALAVTPPMLIVLFRSALALRPHDSDHAECPEVEMSTRGRSPGVDITTKGRVYSVSYTHLTLPTILRV